MTFDEVRRDILRFRDERDWAQFHNPKDLAISVSLEAAELLECFQWSGADLECAERAPRMEEELADVLSWSRTRGSIPLGRLAAGRASIRSCRPGGAANEASSRSRERLDVARERLVSELISTGLHTMFPWRTLHLAARRAMTTA